LTTQPTTEELAQIVTGAELDIRKVPKLVGKEPREKAQEILDLMKYTNVPILLVGDSGSGKSAAMQAVLKAYAAWLSQQRWLIPHGEHLHLCTVAKCGQKYKITEDQYAKAYYFQIAREDTKTTIFLGHRMINGTYKTVKGLLAIAAEQGAVVGVDEIGHATHSLITMFNAFDGDRSVISNGDIAIDGSDMRIIFGTNASTHAGNIRLPQSFVNRVLSVNFDYPNFEDELLIAQDVARRNYLQGQITVPASVARYITTFVRDFRRPTFPLSARNISRGIILCQMAPIINKNVDIKLGRVDKHFLHNNNTEPLRRLITRRVTGKEANGTDALLKPEIAEFIEFVSKIGVPKFKEILLRTVNYHVDSEGLELYDDVKQQIANSLI